MNSMSAPLNAELRDFVDLPMARRLELAETMLPEVVAALRRHSPGGPIAAEEIGGGTAFFGGVNYPANQIVGLGLYDEITGETLDRVESFFRDRGVPSTIVVSPLAHPSLLRLLGERRYRIAEFNSVLIRRLASEEPFVPGPGIVVEKVGEREAHDWSAVLARGFGLPDSAGKEVFEGMACIPDALAYLARVEGTVVGSGAGRVIARGKIAALFGAATLPEYRGRGVQSALIAGRMQEAARAGCEYAVVATHPGSGSQRNMERRGFHVAYTKLVMVREWSETAESG